VATRFLLEAPIGLLPVLAFLATLLYFDSYRLVSFREMLQTLAAGVLLGGVAYYLNGYLLDLTGIGFDRYSHVVSPLVEESLKAAILILVFASNRIGFLIDAIVIGFAVGTGFSIFENIYYLYVFQDADVGVWIIRGFGTAIMHGGATAIFSALSQSFVERRGALNPIYFLPALLAAVVIHAAYNMLEATPMLAALAVLVGLPPLFFLIFTKSEHAVHQWLVDDYKSHEQLLSEINSGRFAHSEAGQFVIALSNKFDKAAVADMFEYLKLHTQLVLRIEALSLAREKGEVVVPRVEDRADLLRLDALERQIGQAALMTLWPHLHFSRRELWELHELHNR
jgi:protease PrsW